MESQSLEEPEALKEEWKGRPESVEWPTMEMEDINQPTSESVADPSESTTTTTDRSEISALPSQQLEETSQELSPTHRQVMECLETRTSVVYSMESEPIREEEKPTAAGMPTPEELITCPEPEKLMEQTPQVKEELREPEQQVADHDRATNEQEEEEEKIKEEQQDGSSQLEKSSASANNNSSGLGRNRRVRQKNRYFQDFHCIDLTKGNRNSRDDYDAFTTATPTASSTRSSNRRSTTDSTSHRTKDDDTAEVLESKYCRKCSCKTAHDIDGGCQACLYKKIVESSKKQRPTSQRGGRGSGKLQHHHHSDRHHHQQTDNSTSVNHIAKTTNSSAGKRRATSKQSGARSGNNVINNNLDNIIASSNNNINNNNAHPLIQDSLTSTLSSNHLLHHSNNLAINNNLSSSSSSSSSSVGAGWTSQAPLHTTANVKTSDSGGLKITITRTNSNDIRNTSSSTASEDLKLCAKVPIRLDSWSPDEVANYILSKGFAQEAECFKTQSVDGISLLLMQRTDFTYGLKIKLGPALKIYDQVCKLKKEYFQSITIPQQ